MLMYTLKNRQKKPLDIGMNAIRKMAHICLQNHRFKSKQKKGFIESEGNKDHGRNN